MNSKQLANVLLKMLVSGFACRLYRLSPLDSSGAFLPGCTMRPRPRPPYPPPRALSVPSFISLSGFSSYAAADTLHRRCLMMIHEIFPQD
jgi:hypothetical protein